MANLLRFRSGLTLLNDQPLFNRIADRIAREHGMDRELAGQVLDQAILFVAAAGRHPGMGLSPSPLVDKGWDTLILYTREYMDLCARVAGRYIHHTPNDDPTREATRQDGAPILTPAETAEIMRHDGYWVLDHLWPAEAKANCTNCYVGDHDGGQGPRP